MMKCNPKNGVNEANTPAAKPAALACGEALTRKTRLKK
jgi:hypothetical protein